jgi:hypothetical protein
MPETLREHSPSMPVATGSQDAFIINSFLSSLSSECRALANHYCSLGSSTLSRACTLWRALCHDGCEKQMGKPGLAYLCVCVCLSDAELVNSRQTEPSVNTGRSPEKCAQQRPKRQTSASQRSSSLPPSSRKANTPSKRCVCLGLRRVTSCVCRAWAGSLKAHRYYKHHLRNLIICQACSRGLSSQLPGRLRIKVQGLPELPSEFKASKPCLKNTMLEGFGI